MCGGIQQFTDRRCGMAIWNRALILLATTRPINPVPVQDAVERIEERFIADLAVMPTRPMSTVIGRILNRRNDRRLIAENGGVMGTFSLDGVANVNGPSSA